ncbi:MAG TPA: hypothetical protein VFW21_10205 [Mycobacterium sp.]|nr:hypothetical protein [Mycobacterium sp.]
MSAILANRATHVAIRVIISAALATSGIAHAYLYIHGYRQISTVGTAFLIQGSAFIALAILILLGGPIWLNWLAALGALGSLIAFGLSRTVGLFGFIEHGWEPPYGPLTVIAQIIALVAIGAGYRVWGFGR